MEKEKIKIDDPRLDAFKGMDLATSMEQQFGEAPIEDENKGAQSQEIIPGGEIKPQGTTQQQSESITEENKTVNDKPTNDHANFLKEIFGEDSSFKTIEEAKKADIPKTLQEVVSLRQAKTDLETKLNAKPKTNFASDEMAKFNEFAKETNSANYGLFKKINDSEITKMDPMDAIVTKYVLDHPNAVGNEENVRKHFEKKYNVDPELVDEEDLAINQIGLSEDGDAAKIALQSIKEKLIVPEPVEDTSKPKELTPEEKTALKTGWTDIGNKVGVGLSKLKIPIKGSNDSLLDYEISEVEQKEIADQVAAYADKNQLELNDANVNMIANTMQNLLVIKKMPEIAHAIFEHARSMTEEQVYAQFENPSSKKNQDSPPRRQSSPMTEQEQIQQKIYEAEKKHMGGW